MVYCEICDNYHVKMISCNQGEYRRNKRTLSAKDFVALLESKV